MTELGDAIYEDGFEEEKPLVFFARFQQYSNILMVSLALHAVILFLVSLINVENKVIEEQKVVITKLDEVPEEIIEEEEPEPEIVVTEPEVVEEEVVTESEVVVEEEVVTETISEITEPTEVEAVQAGTTDLADAPPAIMGVGSGSPAGGGLPYGYKSRSKAGKKGALARFGGAGTTSAVDLALQWLAAHQEYDGSWDQTKYEGDWKNSRVSITSAAVLAFLGAGYSETVGPFKKTVRKGVSWLNEQVLEKQDNPHFDINYGTGMCLMALSEATIFGSKPVTRDNANRLVKAVAKSFNGTGWRYSSVGKAGEHGQDMSVSSWVALGLKSAKAADLEEVEASDIDGILDQFKTYVVAMSNEETGLAGYDTLDRRSDHQMAWISMFCHQALGFPKSTPFLKKCAEGTPAWITSEKPWGIRWFTREEGLGNAYGIYYGTIAAFQQQGEMWKVWNIKMKDALLRTQRKGDVKVVGGSWDPVENTKLGNKGGRVLMTALMALCLEVYYRYEMMS